MLGIIGIEVLIIFVLILANGFFSGSELAIVSARRSRLESAARAGRRGAQQAIALAENPDRFLATVQAGITLIGTFAAAFGGARIGESLAAWLRGFPALAEYAETIALWIVVIGIAYFSLILGELVPKRLALQHAEAVATFAAPVMTTLAWVARPVVALLTGSVGLVLRLLGQKRAAEATVTEEDIVYMVREGAAGGALKAHEEQFIHRVFQFTDRPARAVMTPSTEIIAAEAEAPLAEVLEMFASSGHSRIPVYKGSIDHIIGVLHSNDLLQAVVTHTSTGRDGNVDILRLVRQPTFVPESRHIDDVLAIFRQQHTHLAFVVDEYGATAGILTVQDLLEELVGELPTDSIASGEKAYVQREDGSWLVDAMEPYDRVLEHIGMPPLPPNEGGDFTTMAGLVLERMGHIPVVGDKVDLGDYRLEVVDMDGQRIDRILISHG